MKDFAQRFNSYLPEGLTFFAVVKPIILFLLGFVVMKILRQLIFKVLDKCRLDKNLLPIVRTVVKILLWFVLLLVVTGSMGINVSSLLAVLSIVGVAVSLSVQNILSNFFSGVLLLGSHPFRIGDYVTIAGQSGTVVQTGMIHTKLHTSDNQVILVPNSAVTSNVITNVTAEDTRRVDLAFRIGYDCPTEAVIKALTQAADIPQRLPDQPMSAELSNFGDSAVEYTLRFWVMAQDYGTARSAVLHRVQPCFEANGVKMTYPHINVHTV